MTRRRLSAEREGGFTLIEVMVALIIIALVAAALVPLLIANTRASQFARMSTLAKNLNQQRVDAMRLLTYHVDAQNGPYVDLLDLYYHDASGVVSSIPDIVPGQTVQGQYVAAGGGGGPSGPYYKITIPGGWLGSPYQAFTETVYTQFLVATNPAATPLPASQIPSTYNNSTVGQDTPASPLLGVTVVTTWNNYAVSKSYKTFTEISDTGTGQALLSNEADAIAFRIMTQDYNGNAVETRLGDVTTNGSLANGSQAAATAIAASVKQGGLVSVFGAQSTAVSPGSPGGQGVNASAGQTQIPNSSVGGCTWASFGPSQVSDVSSSTTGGQPVSPSDTDGTPTGAFVRSTLMSNGGGGCSGLWFSNVVDGSPGADASLGLESDLPMVRAQDLSGNSPEVSGASQIWSVNQPGNPGAVTARAATSMSTWVKVFPGVSFPSAPPSSWGITGRPGLVNIQLTNASLACSSTSGGGTAATLSYSGQVAWYTQTAGWQLRSFSWASGGSATDPLSVIDLTQPMNSSGTPLSAYITSISGATGVTGGSGGVQTVEAAVHLSTVPTLGSAYPNTTLGLEFGHLACVAQDNRS